MMTAHFDLEFIARQPQPAKPKALVLLLHGVGGSETNLVDLAGAISSDTLVVMPRGPMTLGAGQYGWFRVNFTSAGPLIVETEAEQSRQTLLRFVAQLQSVYSIAPRKTVIAGFSQGGILSASVARPSSLPDLGSCRGASCLNSNHMLPTRRGWKTFTHSLDMASTIASCP
jgi:phospholipase/carboxylesterase